MVYYPNHSSASTQYNPYNYAINGPSAPPIDDADLFTEVQPANQLCNYPFINQPSYPPGYSNTLAEHSQAILPLSYNIQRDVYAIKRVGHYNGNEIIEINSSGKQYVVYEKNPSVRHLIAMPYKGLHTLRSTQTIASSVLGLLTAGLVAKTALAFSASVLSTSLVSAIAGVLILGIGMIYTWYYNDQDPDAQMEIRNKQLREQTIDFNQFTTPKEKRSFLFSKVYRDIKEFSEDLRTLMRLNLLSRNEILFYNQHTAPLAAKLVNLEHEYESKIAPHKDSMIDETARARSKYYRSSAVQSDHMIDHVYNQAKLAKANNTHVDYNKNDAAMDLAYIGAKQLNRSALEHEETILDQKISRAEQKFAVTQSEIKSEINYNQRLEEIRREFETHNWNFKQNFCNECFMVNDSNVAYSVESDYLLHS